MIQKPRALFFIAVIVAATALVCVQAQSTDYKKLVTAADIQTVTGMKDVALLSSSPANDSLLGALMFSRRDGALVAVVNFAKPGTFVMDKAHTVAGVGDEAFESADHSSLCFRKGNRPVIIASGVGSSPKSGGLKPILMPEHLRALARIIYSRM